MDNTYSLHSSSKKKEKRNIVLDGSTMEYEKRTITSFVKYRRRENGQYLQTAFIIEEKGKKKHRVRRFNHGIRKKRTITSFVKYRRRENGQYLHPAFIIEEKGKKKETSC
jgi:hypothetical protein